MKKIIKISENTYLVDGTYLTKSYSHAVLKANENTVMPSFHLENIELSLWEKVKYFFNSVLDSLEVIDPDSYI